MLALDYVQKSSFCTGMSLSQGESIQVPHISGAYKNLANGDQQENVKVQKFKQQRKEKRMGIHPKCNKRYLSKEVTLQLKQERKARVNAEKRAKYWKDKFENESVTVEDDDHVDLSTMLNSVPKDKVPEEMACLLDQQEEYPQNKEQTRIQMAP